MNITIDLFHIVEQAHSLIPILDSATRVIAERLRVDGCSVFLLDEHGDLVQSPAEGACSSTRSERVRAEAGSIAVQVTAESRVVTAHGETASFLGSPMLLRDNIVGALVVQSSERRDYSVQDIETLAAICAQLVGIIENARIIEALDRGDQPKPRAAPRPSSTQAGGEERVFAGVGASPGVAVGPAVFRGAYRLDLSSRALPAGEASTERERVRTAFRKTNDDISRVQVAAAREIDEEHALIFTSHLLLLKDPTLLERIDQKIIGGVSAPLAIDAALDEFETRLRLVSDPYIREKIDDIDDLRTRLLDHVLDSGGRARIGRGIVLTSRIPPSLVIELKTEDAQGLVTETGGATSHGAILARALGIPLVTGVADMLPSVRPGDQLVVDGTTGSVIVRPSEETVIRCVAERQRAERERTEHARFRNVLARTSDGERVTLQANVGVASDIAVARDNGAEGIGLYRTEFPFIVRDSFPTRAEQVKIYSKAYEPFPAGPVNFRILDLGGDKFMAGDHLGAARGAFNGYRSIRVLFDHPDVLRDQVQAFAMAAADCPLRILIPMVTSLEELRHTKAMIDQALASLDEPRAQRAPEIGVMIEVPAAVELAADIANEADFLSIGTNDLMQYTLVVDREDSRMAAMNDPYHPAILRMVARVAAAANAAGKPVGVCGEVAVRPDMALALMALGVDSLSVVPNAIPELKQALAGARLEPMRRAMKGILALPEACSVAAALREARFA
jgi:phosphotransferase system enzyme I (PtsP)